MNESSTDQLTSIDFPPSVQGTRGLPRLALQSSVQGPCFSLEVVALREGADLRIEQMRVVGSSLDGVPRVAYTFTEAIDAAGVTKLAPLLVQISATNDPLFLSKLIQATEGHSVGEWSAEALTDGIAYGSSLRPIIPPFEAFAKDVGILSREFTCRSFQRANFSEMLEARIATWGEFIELRTWTSRETFGSRFVPVDLVKVLLPADENRALHQSYVEAKRLVEDIAKAHSMGGFEAVCKFLAEHNLTVIQVSTCDMGGPLKISSVAVGGQLIAACSEVPAPGMEAFVRYHLNERSADIQLCSESAVQKPLVELRISSGDDNKSLSATHIRCIVGLVDCLRSQRWKPETRYERILLEKLLLLPVAEVADREPSRGKTPSEEALASLSYTAIAYPSDPESFFSPEVHRHLKADPRCFISNHGNSDPLIVSEALKGARWIAIELAPQIRRRNPHQFWKLELFYLSDDTLRVRAVNDLGGSVQVTTGRFSQTKSDHSRQYLGDLLYRALTDQELSGWTVLYDSIQAIATPDCEDHLGDVVVRHLPDVTDEVARQGVERAGRIAFLLLRGGDYGLKCGLALADGHQVQLSSYSTDLRGAVDIVLEGSTVTELRFYHIEKGLVIPGALWERVGTLRCSESAKHPLPDSALVRSIRSYFRDRLGPEASVGARPEGDTFWQIARTLEREGFVVAG